MNVWIWMLKNLADVLVVEAVPLAIAKRLDAGVVVSTCGTPRMHHYREEFVRQWALQKDVENEI